MIYIITPTCDRPVQLGFCIELMSRQTYTGDVTWIIADNSKESINIPQIKNWNIVHKKLQYTSSNSQGSNLIAALGECDPEKKIIVIEDDDFYHHDWLNFISAKLDNHHIAGEIRAKYYNLKNSTYKIHSNKKHSSLCSTGICGNDAYLSLLNICKHNHRFIDIHFWHNFKGSKNLFAGNYVVGIKGMAGKSGIGMGHRGMLPNIDQDHTILKQWVGDEWAEKYINAL